MKNDNLLQECCTETVRLILYQFPFLNPSSKDFGFYDQVDADDVIKFLLREMKHIQNVSIKTPHIDFGN